MIHAELDESPYRCNTRGIFSLFLANGLRLLIIGTLIAAMAMLSGILKSIHPIDFMVVIWLVLGAGMLINFTFAIFYDYRRKKVLAEKYGIRIRYGVDSFQQRSIRVTASSRKVPEAMISKAVVDALRSVSPQVDVMHKESNVFVSTFETARRVPYHLTVSVITKPAETTVRIESSSRRAGLIPQRPLRPDGGQSIVNVEEFQAAFKRQIEDGQCDARRAGRAPL